MESREIYTFYTFIYNDMHRLISERRCMENTGSNANCSNGKP